MTAPENYTPAPSADFILPFDLPKAGMRGRLVRLDLVSARALSAHVLPEAAARVAAESLVLSALLGSALKLDGRLSVQVKGDGPVDLVAADYYGALPDSGDGVADGLAGVRAYARADAAGVAAIAGAPVPFEKLVGAGSLAITIEPRAGSQTYQGIVALSPKGIAASAETYFAQSEQLATSVKLAAAPLFEAGKTGAAWRAAGILLQATPERAAAQGGAHDGAHDDDWERLTLHLDTLEDFELLDTELAAETLLWRLFNEDEVRVQPALGIAFRCTCDTGRIAAALASYSAEEREGLADADGVIRARCEFCGTSHEVVM